MKHGVFGMSDDLISRQAAIDSLLEAFYDLDEYDFVDKVFIEEELKRVPSVQPEQKTGRWIMHISDLFPAESTMECSNCKHEQPLIIDDSYCPNCGAKMEK